MVGKEQDIFLQTELSSCFEHNKVALKIDVLCDPCSSDGVGVSNPGFWGMVRIVNNVSQYELLFPCSFPFFHMMVTSNSL